ncbi:MAG: helix-turn-helix domain-containing protein [Clostridia bacterium]|nr:helix-turn-helix domain-containing protein [Clostridia bacterium]
MITLGKNLRKARRRKGMTQEQVAEATGVSPQAVSRWENDSAYPDITTLAGLAMPFGTSLDALVGMQELRDADSLRNIHGRVLALVAQGQDAEAEQLIRESLRIYPDNSGLLMALGETLAHGDRLDEAIAVEERVLRCDDISLKARCTTMVNLLFLYRATGAWEKAKRLVKDLPHIWESREMMLAEVDEHREQALKAAIRKTLVVLCRKIDGLGDTGTPDYVQLGVDFETEMSAEDMIEKIEKFLA